MVESSYKELISMSGFTGLSTLPLHYTESCVEDTGRVD